MSVDVELLHCAHFVLMKERDATSHAQSQRQLLMMIKLFLFFIQLYFFVVVVVSVVVVVVVGRGCVYNTIASRLPKGQNSITKPNGVIHYIHINQNAHTQTQTYELFLPFPIMEQCLDVMESTTLYPKENDE
jgi:hypothetical protein